MTLSRALGTALLAALLPSPQPQAATVSAVDTFVAAEMARQRIPGLAVAVVKEGKVLVSALIEPALAASR